MGAEEITWSEAAKAIPDLVRLAYGDLVQPGAQQVGKALSTVLGLGNTLLWPIALLNGAADITLRRNLDRLRKKLAVTPLEEIVPITPEIGVPIAEKIAFASDPIISELYLTILAKAATRENCQLAHPSFANVIANFSPDDAKLFGILATQENLPALSVRATNTNDTTAYKELRRLIPSPDVLDILAFPAQVAVYVSNLEGLGLMLVRSDIYITQLAQEYVDMEAFYHMQFGELYKGQLSANAYQLQFGRQVLSITSFGRLFANAVDIEAALQAVAGK